jgi:prepilin-type N-terminal cleavage/methylation domain-containing protein
MRLHNSRRGITLLELLIALSMVGLLLTGAATMLDQLGDEGSRIAQRKAARDARESGRQTLRALVHRVEATPDSSERFTGDESRASFTTWCNAPGGWLERCRVHLRIAPIGDSSGVFAVMGNGREHHLWMGGPEAKFRYHGAAALEPWVQTWINSIVAPSGIGIVVGTDTLVLPAGSRS